MTQLFYYLLILPISLLPMPVLYRVSDVLFILIFHVIRYRKNVVYTNIHKSFPEKTESEHDTIARDFYRHFCDLIVESFKGFTISKREIGRRFKVRNPEVLHEAFANGQSIILTGGHYNNWEWLAVALRQQIRHRACALYKPLTNSFLEGKMRSTRSRYGLEMIPLQKAKIFFAEEIKLINEKRALPFFIIFGIDQTPGDPNKAHWAEFLNQDTAIPFGAEKFAREYSLPVFFGCIHKVARGYYEFECRPLSLPPHPDAKGWILEEATKLLEIEIKKIPQYWLWTHRRWKRPRTH